MTNAEKIRNMSDEELAKFLSNKLNCYDCDALLNPCNMALPCQQNYLNWLQSEVKVTGEESEKERLDLFLKRNNI